MVKVCIITFGCSLNKYDSIIMEYHISKAGYEIIDNINDSNIVVINTCGVKKQTEDRIIDFIRKLNKRYRGKIIVTGCLPLINFARLSREVKYDALLGPSPGHRIVEAIEHVLSGKEYIYLSETPYPEMPRDFNLRKPSVIMPVGISSGCLDRCSFCGGKLARGYVKSHSIDEIKTFIRCLVRQGVKEIHLTSTDLGAYGFDLNPRRNIIDLLKEITSIEYDFIVRLGMMNPRWVYKWLDDLIDILASSDKFFYFIHIPIQSGSDRVLKIMNRGHTTMEYVESVKRIRNELDYRFSIATDIIVGHPGETDEDFELTLEIIKESEPDFVNISKFFPRPNTPSKFMKQLSSQIIKERSRVLSKLVDDILLKRNKLWLNWRGSILLDEYGRKGTLVGRNYAYKIFVINKIHGVDLGNVVRIQALDAYTTWIKADILGLSSLSELKKEFVLHRH